jgi:ABC-type oligopeptide transport system ATPase subunit
MIFQDPAGSLNPRLTILDNITEPLQHLKKDWSRQQQRDQAYRLMQKVGLEERHLNRYPHEFSGGQCQRIGIARALAPEPKLILCDEAVSALDVSVQAQVLNCLQDLSKELQLSLLFVTHDLAVVRYLADHICVMEKGRIVERGPTESLITSPQHKATQELIAAAPSLKSFDP